MHLPLPLEYKVMVSSIKRETTLLLHDTGKNKLKVFTWKTITPPFSKILLVARFTLLWRHDGQARQPRSRVYGPSLLLRRFVFRMAEASAKQVTVDEPQGTTGRVQTAGEARCLLPAFLCARNFIKRETSGYEAGRNPFKLNGSVRSNKKSFEKTGPPFEVDYFSRSGRLEFWLNGSRPMTPSWFFPNLSTFLGCSCCTDQYSWYVAAKALVLSLRSVWCHSNHVKAHASDATIIVRFASTRSSCTQVLLAGNLFTQENESKACSKLSTRRVVGKIRMLAKPRNPCKLSLFRFHSSA